MKKYLIVHFLVLCFFSCKKSEQINYRKSNCTSYRKLFLTKKQKSNQGQASFAGYTDFGKFFEIEFSKQLLLYFKKGKQPYRFLLDEEINNEEITKECQKKRYHLIVATDIKIAKEFDVPITHLPQGGWEIASDYLFVIKNLHMEKVFKDICEEEIITLLKNGDL